MSEEIELKLELDAAAVEALAGQEILRQTEPRSKRLVSVYYDTPGSKLRKRGYSLRVRSKGDGFVQTVRSLEPASGLLSRGEWEIGVASLEPHVEHLQQTPAGQVDSKKLQPVVSSSVDRKSWHVHDEADELEIALDEGAVRADGREDPICELEIELREGDPAAAFRAARALAHNVPLKLAVLSKAERGFALADGWLGKVSKAGPVPVDKDMSVAEGFAAIVQSCIRHFRLNEPLIIERRDPAALHQARVAMRRLRTALSLFRPAVSDGDFARLREDVRWFTSQLGEARNLDVYLEGEVPKAERKALLQRREQAYDEVIGALNSTRLRLLMIDLLAWVTLGEWRSRKKASRPFAVFADRRIGRLWLRICGHDDLRRLDDEERHELRIEVKKLRYALDFIRALTPGADRRQKRFTAAIQGLQEALGRLNDIVVARQITGDPQGASDQRARAEERANCIREATRCFNRLKVTGPYWTRHHPAPAG